MMELLKIPAFGRAFVALPRQGTEIPTYPYPEAQSDPVDCKGNEQEVGAGICKLYDV